jgi:hypothetical protein
VRKTPLVLDLLTGMELTQGAITQDALRWARCTRDCGLGFGTLRWSILTTPTGR